MTQEDRRSSLAAAGLLHPHPDAVRAQLFHSDTGFFLPLDKIQVKYEMLRAHVLDGVPIVRAASEHGYSRAAFYLIVEAFETDGMLGLLDDKRGRAGPLKVTPDIQEYARGAPQSSGATLSKEVAERFGVLLHRRTLERLRRK